MNKESNFLLGFLIIVKKAIYFLIINLINPKLYLAHRHSSKNREEVLASKECGCFYCLRIFTPDKIEDWIDSNKEGIAQTALCPFCGVDSVLGSKSGYSIENKFLEKMHKIWF